MSFTAVILAGGRSSRMGRDKSGLLYEGQTWLARQLNVVQAAGASEILVSGRPDRDDSRLGFKVLTDVFPDGGPVSGIHAALQAARHPSVLVLAVDMIGVSAEFLIRLQGQLAGLPGGVPRIQGRLEPLVAWYPRQGKEWLGRQLAASAGTAPVLGAQVFARWCVEQGWSRYLDLPAADLGHFANWNTPDEAVAGGGIGF
ncbi:MAG TPA: molybdenum cofactor guanylyltransferase [Verrucomicrobiae bacterium]